MTIQRYLLYKETFHEKTDTKPILIKWEEVIDCALAVGLVLRKLMLYL